MSQRTQILAEIWGYRGWNVSGVRYENGKGQRLRLLAGIAPADAIVVLLVERRWAPRCACCGAIAGEVHEQLQPRRW